MEPVWKAFFAGLVIGAFSGGILALWLLGMCQAARRGDERMGAEDERGQK